MDVEVYRDGKILIPAQESPVNPYHPEREFYTTDFFTDAALDYVDRARARRDEPFLLHVCYNAPHFPLEAPDELIEKYRGRYLRGWDELRQERHARMIAMGLVKEEWTITDRDPNAPPEEIPLGQRLFDNWVVLLVACIVVMFVFYTGWGVVEMVSLPDAPLP